MPADDDAAAREFDAALGAFTRALQRVRGRYNRAPKVPELSSPQLALVEPLLDVDGPLTIGALAEAADVAPPSATRMLDGLAQRGIVVRERSDADRRAVRIALTDEGRRLAERKRAVRTAARRELFESLPPEQRANAAALLRQLAESTEELGP